MRLPAFGSAFKVLITTLPPNKPSFSDISHTDVERNGIFELTSTKASTLLIS